MLSSIIFVATMEFAWIANTFFFMIVFLINIYAIFNFYFIICLILGAVNKNKILNNNKILKNMNHAYSGFSWKIFNFEACERSTRLFVEELILKSPRFAHLNMWRRIPFVGANVQRNVPVNCNPFLSRPLFILSVGVSSSSLEGFLCLGACSGSSSR